MLVQYGTRGRPRQGKSTLQGSSACRQAEGDPVSSDLSSPDFSSLDVEFEICKEDEGIRLDRVLAQHTGIPRSRLRFRFVKVDGREVRPKDSAPLGAKVQAGVSDATCGTPSPAFVDVPVLWERDDYVVVEKPAGMVVHPPANDPSRVGTLIGALLARYPEIKALGADGGQQRPGIVHRIDKDTSGILLVARTPRGLAEFRRIVADRALCREYVALVSGLFDVPSGEINAPIGRRSGRKYLEVTQDGRFARTSFTVECAWERPSLSALTVFLHTGRTHQIRVHMAAVGHPVVGDPMYGGRAVFAAERQFLHARRLAFSDPFSGEEISVVSPLPSDLCAVLAKAGRPVTGELPVGWSFEQTGSMRAGS